MDNLLINHTQTDRTITVIHEVVQATKTHRKHYVLIVRRKGIILHTRKMSLRKIKQFVKAFKGVKQRNETKALILAAHDRTTRELRQQAGKVVYITWNVVANKSVEVA